MYLTKQPEDHLRCIYPFLNFRDILSLEQTSRVFKGIKKHITEIVIIKDYIDVEAVSALLRKPKSLKVLILRDLGIYDDETLKLLNFSDLSKLVTFSWSSSTGV